MANISKCLPCNGKGTSQIFDNKLNRWVTSSNICKYCNGFKVRYSVDITSKYDFIKKSVYIPLPYNLNLN